MGPLGDAAVLGMGEQCRALSDDLVLVASDHLAEAIVDFDDLVFRIEEHRASHVVIEREVETLLATRGGIDDVPLGLGAGVFHWSLSAVLGLGHQDLGLPSRRRARRSAFESPAGGTDAPLGTVPETTHTLLTITTEQSRTEQPTPITIGGARPPLALRGKWGGRAPRRPGPAIPGDVLRRSPTNEEEVVHWSIVADHCGTSGAPSTSAEGEA